VEYFFNERQALFTVAKSNPAFDRILSIATQGLEGNKLIKLTYSGYNTFEELMWPTTAETTRYLEWYRANIVKINCKDMRPIFLTLFNRPASYFYQKLLLRLLAATIPACL
jgi:hypothetical protein